MKYLFSEQTGEQTHTHMYVNYSALCRSCTGRPPPYFMVPENFFEQLSTLLCFLCCNIGISTVLQYPCALVIFKMIQSLYSLFLGLLCVYIRTMHAGRCPQIQ